MENNQILQEMYSIRAVMSVLSSEKDKIEELDASESGYKENVDKINNDKLNDEKLIDYNFKKRLNSCEEEYATAVSEIKTSNLSLIEIRLENIKNKRKEEYGKLDSNFNDKRATTIEGVKNLIRENKKARYYCLGFTIVFLALAICSFTVFNKIILGVIFSVLTAVILVCMLGNEIGIRSHNEILNRILIYEKEINDLNAKKKTDEEYVSSKKKEEEELKKADEDFGEEKERIESQKYEEIINIESKYTSLLNDAFKEFNNKKKKQKQLIANSKTLYENTVQKYGKVLDERDWKHLDLIIYYLETGRANSIKEALILVDNQVNADNIVDAIYSVGDRISQTIIKSSQYIAREMHKGFMNLSQEIETLNKNNLMSSQEQNQLLRDLISETNLQTQLQKKANETSEDLADDIAYIKMREEYKFMKS